MAGKRPNIEPERDGPGIRDGSRKARSERDAALSVIQLGRVYLESDSYSDAVDYLIQADTDEFRSQLTQAEIAGLYASIARCYLGLGELEVARTYAGKVDELDLGEEEEAAEARVVLAKIEVSSGRFRQALEAAKKAYSVLRAGSDTPLLAEASKAMGTAHAELGDTTAARDCFVECLVTNRRLENQAGIAGAYNNLGILAKRSGDLAAAVEYFERALVIDRKLGRPASIARRLNNLGVAHYRLSRWAEAEECLQEAWDIYSRLGATRDLVGIESALGNLCRVRREWGRARKHFEHVLETSRRAGYRRSEALALEFLGELEMDQNDHGKALGTLADALECAQRLSSNSDVIGEVLRRRAEALLKLGRIDEAERDGARALALTRKIGDRLEEGATLRVLASIAYARGDRAAARASIDSAEELLRRTGESFELARTALANGVGLRESSQPDDLPVECIEGVLSTAEELFETLGADFWVARCRLERAKTLQKAGLRGRARSWLARIRPELERAGDGAGLAESDALLAELDHELALAGGASPSRYSVIADGYRHLQTAQPDLNILHRLASNVAEAVSADRLVLFAVDEGTAMVATSVDRTGRRLAEVKRFVRLAVGGPGPLRPVVAGGRWSSDGSAPSSVAAMALVPAAPPPDGETEYVLYADRLKDARAASFGAADVEFVGAAAGMLGLAHAGAKARHRLNPADPHRQDDATALSEVVARDPRMLAILDDVERLRDSSIPVLILGESGVGKDVVARMIHDGGRSATGRFVALNAGAVVPTLQESELFGHAKGAFTDAARDREGMVEVAKGGTLFLDEIGEMSLELQVKLLRFLQSGEYRRVGESSNRTSDARIISASNRNLRAEVAAERFRTDLFYRLCGFVIDVPPLRERPQDIPPLMEHFLDRYTRLEGKRVDGFSPEVRELFLKHDWRGNNVRELENEVRRGVALCEEGGVIGLDEIRPELAARREEILRSGRRDGTHPLSLKEEVEALERNRIREALERSGRSKRAAAKLLGLSRTGLYTKLAKYGME